MRTMLFGCLTLAITSSLYAFDKAVVTKNGNALYEYRVEDRGRFGHRLSVFRKAGGKDSLLTKVKIQYKVYQFAVDDINGDGVVDMLVGVIKRTRYDPIEKKRLFVYTMDKEQIRPLWLGSKVGTGLEDFRIVKFGTRKAVLTLEGDSSNTHTVRLYTFGSFGPIWRKNIIRRGYEDAIRKIFISYSQ